jgi:hypothetical protein
MNEEHPQSEADNIDQLPPDDGMPDGLAAVKKATDFALSEVLDALREIAREKGGDRLTFSEIKFQFQAFMDDPNADMVSPYENAWRACSTTAQATQWQKVRKFPLERLVVRRFEHLFPPRGQPAIQGEHLSRRVIGPFMFALQQLLGPELHEQYETRCRDLVTEQREIHGDNFRWEMVDKHPDADSITDDVLVHSSRHFDNLDRRRRWLVDLIDGNMPAAKNELERPWQFGENEFRILMKALFGDIPEQLADPATMSIWRRRYNEASLVGLVTLLENLEQ